MNKPFRKTSLGKFWRLAKQKYQRLRREIYQRWCVDRTTAKRILLIVGCQRSGTTLMGEVFAKDMRTAVLQEKSCITQPASLRLKPYQEVNQTLRKLQAPIIVAKPLVETQWTPEMVAGINGAKALWMYRDFRDVVSSNLKRFRSQVEGLRLTISGEPPTWRAERISEATKSILLDYFREDMPPADAAALGWYRRNILFFELDLDENEGVLLCNYEHLVREPLQAMQRIYRHMGVDYPRFNLTSIVDTHSIGIGKRVKIHNEISELCCNLMERLESLHRQQLLASNSEK